MAAVRRAEVAWKGDLAKGGGVITSVTSAAISSLPVTWASRTEAPDGRTSPEELIAAAHASCFSMALTAALGRAGTPPESLGVSAEITFDRVDNAWTVVSSALAVRGRVPGMDQVAFQQAAEGAKDNCPVSRALKGNVQLTVNATLES